MVSNRHQFVNDFAGNGGLDFDPCVQVFPYRVPHVLNGFPPRVALTATAWKIIAPRCNALFGFDKSDSVFHGDCYTPLAAAVASISFTAHRRRAV